MPVTSHHDLLNRANALLRDTRPLHTAAGLGFIADRTVTSAAASSLAADASWSVVDARESSNDDVRAALISALGARRPIALIVPVGGGDVKAPMSALLFAQAIADRAERVDLGDLTPRAVPRDINVVVLAAGVAEHAQLPRQLQRVDFWEFLT